MSDEKPDWKASEAGKRVLLWESLEDDEEVSELPDALYDLFAEIGPRHWTDVAHIARDVYSAMFDEIEFESPVASVIDSACAQAADGAFAAVAAALGVSLWALKDVVDDWYENDSAVKQPPVSLEEFARRLEVSAKEESERFGDKP